MNQVGQDTEALIDRQSAFEGHPGFYEGDHRKDRYFYPVSREQLEKKHRAMFSEWNLAGKSVLDLGSCLGATGQWALFNGASRYVGVEAQAPFVERSRELMAHHGEKAEVVHATITDFLSECDEQFDVVVMLGVIYGFVDQLDIVRKVTRVCRETCIIEGCYPKPSMGNNTAPIIEINPNNGMVAADSPKNLLGVGARISPMALEILMGMQGFEPIGKHPEPRQIYGTIDNYNGDPGKQYYLRYICTFRNSGKVQESLESVMARVDDDDVRSADWDDINIPEQLLQPQKAVERVTPWVFDDAVAERFEQEAHQHIPDYERVLDYCEEVAITYLPRDAAIVDVGCSKGALLERLEKKGFSNLLGVDACQAMLDRAYRDSNNAIRYVCSTEFPKGDGPYVMAAANWTLHFVSEREAYLRDIYESLHVRGFLILSEKVTQTRLSHSLYHKFKRDQGVPPEYIKEKEEALKDVLVPYPMDWYLIKLREIGFRWVEVVNANRGFITFFAQK